MEKTCSMCEKISQCQTPCKPVADFLWEDNRIMERHFQNKIVCYPVNNEVHFSELAEQQKDQFSTDDVIPWSSGDLRLRKTTVFVERFFNKVPCKDLAARFNVKENTIVCMYRQAVEQLERIIDTLDARKEGIKAMKPEKFTEDQKFFLLCCVFGFSQAEVARMFKRDRNAVNKKVKRLADRYKVLFKEPEIKKSIYDNLSVSEIKERMAY